MCHIRRQHLGIPKNGLSHASGGYHLRFLFSDGTWDNAMNVKSIKAYISKLAQKNQHGDCYVFSTQSGEFEFFTKF